MLRRHHLNSLLVPAVAVAVALLLWLDARPTAQAAQDRIASKNTSPQSPAPRMPLRFSALAVRTVAPSATGTVDITIQRWSTDAEREKFITAIVERGSAKLIDVLRALPPIGRVSGAGSIGFELRYAQAETLSTGAQRILLATDRPMSFWETTDRPRSIDYPFTVFELRVNSLGQGDGKVSVAAQLTAGRDHRSIVIENLEDQPVLLRGLKRLAN